MEKSLGRYLRECRQKKGLSLREMFERAHFHSTYLSKIENDHMPPGVDVLNAYIRHCGADRDTVYLASDRMPPDILPLVKADPSLLDALRRREVPHGKH